MHTYTHKTQKKEDQHYGKLDHGVKKQSTLPTSVVPPPSDSEYGKLDRVHTCVHAYIYICMMTESKIKGIPASVNNVDAIVSASCHVHVSWNIKRPYDFPILCLYV